MCCVLSEKDLGWTVEPDADGRHTDADSERPPTVSAFTHEVPELLIKILKTPIYNKLRSKPWQLESCEQKVRLILHSHYKRRCSPNTMWRNQLKWEKKSAFSLAAGTAWPIRKLFNINILHIPKVIFIVTNIGKRAKRSSLCCCSLSPLTMKKLSLLTSSFKCF